MAPSPEPTESDRLRRSWDRCDSATLDVYLVSGVEDPRINVPSILGRGLLCDTLFPGRFAHQIEEELRFGFAMTWLVGQLDHGVPAETLLRSFETGGQGVCPDFLLDTFERLQRTDSLVPDYLTLALADRRTQDGLSLESLDVFQIFWRRALQNLSHESYELFEAACGSANDYRAIASCGLARFFRYTGVDIAAKNIDNARRRFPNVDFRVGDLLNSRLPDRAFDFSFAYDVFEHLSPEALSRAVSELLRVTRREAWLHLFNAANTSSHQIHPVGDYYWNALSLGRMIGLLEQSASHVEVVSIAELAQTKFGFRHYYNPNAYALLAIR
ncbi:MAG: class I SAM-dependent methyltransferase [Thermoguttaceae bacterium]